MTHQEGIARCLTTLLAQDNATIAIFRRGNPFSMLIRSFDEFNSIGEGLYHKELGRKHYKMSVNAYDSPLKADKLVGEHCIPIKITIAQLLAAPKNDVTAVLRILLQNEVVLVTKEEQRRVDASIKNGGLALRSKMPTCGSTRLEAAGIAIAPETLHNTLLVP